MWFREIVNFFLSRIEWQIRNGRQEYKIRIFLKCKKKFESLLFLTMHMSERLVNLVYYLVCALS